MPSFSAMLKIRFISRKDLNFMKLSSGSMSLLKGGKGFKVTMDLDGLSLVVSNQYLVEILFSLQIRCSKTIKMASSVDVSLKAGGTTNKKLFRPSNFQAKMMVLQVKPIFLVIWMNQARMAKDLHSRKRVFLRTLKP